jgi:hypothetical protein
VARIEAAKIEAAKAYNRYVEKLKTSQRRWRLDFYKRRALHVIQW